ncbi:MAG: rRNA maturation RNase YbeY [Candidatus Omnitrophica bacterium]|nr:rRNA maturation RNase YbeY [Candidatus Omnitrophota bacterium]
MEIVITNLQKKIPLQVNPIKNIVQAILLYLKIKNSVLSVVFVSSQKIRALNKKFLNRSYATDVLAFDLSDTKNRSGLTGDVIISTDAIKQNAKKFKSTEQQELVLYIIHGILHLSGYDDHNSKDIRRMRLKEQEILEYLGKTVNNTIS